MKSLYPAKLPTGQRQLRGQKQRATPDRPQLAPGTGRMATPGCPHLAAMGQWGKGGGEGQPAGLQLLATLHSTVSEGRPKPLVPQHANLAEPAALRGREAATTHRAEPQPSVGLRCE